MFPRIYFFKTNGNLKQTASEDMKSMTKTKCHAFLQTKSMTYIAFYGLQQQVINKK